MTLFSWIVFIFIGILTFLPLTRLSAFRASRRFSYFRYTSIALFIWFFILLIRYVTELPYVIYYLSLAVYPIVFASTAMFFLSVNNYVGNKRLPNLEVLFGIIFILDVVASFTNPLHMEMLKIAPSSSITLESMRVAMHGWIFLVFLIINYILALAVMVLAVTKMYDDMKKDKDYLPFLLVIFGIIVTLTFNFIQVFVTQFALDPTYITYVIFLSLLYFLISIRDLKIITYFDNNNLIIDNLREMYVIVNQRNMVIDASDELLDNLDLNLKYQDIELDDLMEKMSKHAIIYRDSKELGNEFQKDTYYLHMKEKVIRMPLFKYTGHLLMFYDETDTQKYINELDYVLSHDLMTNIFNRNFYEENKKTIESECENYAMVVFDLDGLKLRNDFLGHEAGDDFLFRFAKILVEIVDDHIGRMPIRMGGDEFLLIIQNTDKEEIKSLIERMELVAQDEDPLLNIMFSYGYFFNSDKDIDIDKALAAADRKMYEKKKGNRIKKQEFEIYLKSITEEKD